MKSTHRSILLAIVVLLAATTACIENAEANNTDPLPQMQATQELPPAIMEEPTAVFTECSNAYLPVREGARWDYTLSGLFADTFTRRIINVQPNAFTDQDAFGTGVIRNGNWQCSAGNLTALDPASGTSASISSEGIWMDFRTTSQEGVTLPASLITGAAWAQRLTIEGKLAISATQYDARNQVYSTCTAAGVESVSVPAGTFQAMRIDCRTTMEISVNLPDKPSKNNLTLNISNWYAENVGLVKTVTTGDGLDGTVELTFYSIP